MKHIKYYLRIIFTIMMFVFHQALGQLPWFVNDLSPCRQAGSFESLRLWLWKEESLCLVCPRDSVFLYIVWWCAGLGHSQRPGVHEIPFLLSAATWDQKSVIWIEPSYCLNPQLFCTQEMCSEMKTGGLRLVDIDTLEKVRSQSKIFTMILWVNRIRESIFMEQKATRLGADLSLVLPKRLGEYWRYMIGVSEQCFKLCIYFWYINVCVYFFS